MCLLHRFIGSCVAAVAALVASVALAAPFAPPTSHPIGDFPVRVTVGDLDDDGWNDLVVCNALSRDLSIVMNRAGTLQPEYRIDPGDEPRQAAIGDVDGDGDRDLVVVLRGTTAQIAVLENAGDGTFLPATLYGPGDMNFSVKLADVDLDGDLDALTIGAFVGATKLTVLLNDGAGAFTVGSVHDAAETDVVYVADLDVADLDGDGFQDVATVLVNSDSVTVLFNRGDGTFSPFVPVDLGQTAPSAVLLRDVDRDGASDLVVVDMCSENDMLRVGHNDGTGGFALAQALPLDDVCHAFTNPAGVVAGYFDGDVHVDLAYASFRSGSVRVLGNRGDGTFEAGDVLATGGEPLTVSAGDLDGDGNPDLLDGNLTEHAVPDAVTTARNDACAPFFIERWVADDAGFAWATTLPYHAVRGTFTTSAEIGDRAVDRQFTDTGRRFDDADVPSPGSGFWYLVRPDCPGSSWTSAGTGEAAGRDAALP